MADHAHYIAKCKHGLVRFQCRCAAADKRVDMVECDERCPADPPAETDWIAEAQRLGEWRWYPNIRQGSIYAGDFVRVDSRGETEEEAARDAVLRLRKLALKVLPEYAELLAAVRSWAAEMEPNDQRLLDVLARIDAKENADAS